MCLRKQTSVQRRDGSKRGSENCKGRGKGRGSRRELSLPYSGIKRSATLCFAFTLFYPSPVDYLLFLRLAFYQANPFSVNFFRKKIAGYRILEFSWAEIENAH